MELQGRLHPPVNRIKRSRPCLSEPSPSIFEQMAPFHGSKRGMDASSTPVGAQVAQGLTMILISIPYHALHQLGDMFMNHVVDALRSVAASPRDSSAGRRMGRTRRVSCRRHHSPFWSRPCGDDWSASVVSALWKAAELGDVWRCAPCLGGPWRTSTGV
jgi:hypothetical protein